MTVRRIGAFVGVGAIGFAVQIGAVAWLTTTAGWPYAPATALAVELAVLHNFGWHERWTWADRTVARGGMRGRLARFHVVTGLTSILGNLALTALAVEWLTFNAIAANVMAVAGMSAINFWVADRWVFGGSDGPVSAARRP